MRIVIMGAGRMGAWLVEEFCHDHDVAVFDTDPKKLKYFIKVARFLELSEIEAFQPELLVNAVTLKNTIEAFDAALPFLPANCMLSDITSVKNGIYQYYQRSGRRFVSTHPMFGPTFANIRDLRNENAIIISESDEDGKTFFRNFYQNLKLNIFEYSFEEHDETTAYSLGTPFSSSLVFAACLKNQKAPGTTFKKHMDIARGLLSEDDFLLSEVLFNPKTLKQIERINSQLAYLTHIIRGRDYEEMKKFLDGLRENIR